jgi:hypothetical protein
MPAWVYTLGSYFLAETNISLPFTALIGRLLFTIVPCLIGVLISKFVPKTKLYVLRIAKPVALFIVLSFLILTVIIKSYIYALVELKQWVKATFFLFYKHVWFGFKKKYFQLVGPFIPWSGFLVGGLVAYLFRLPVKQIYTIAIETG